MQRMVVSLEINVLFICRMHYRFLLCKFLSFHYWRNLKCIPVVSSLSPSGSVDRRDRWEAFDSWASPHDRNHSWISWSRDLSTFPMISSMVDNIPKKSYPRNESVELRRVNASIPFIDCIIFWSSHMVSSPLDWSRSLETTLILDPQILWEVPS